MQIFTQFLNVFNNIQKQPPRVSMQKSVLRNFTKFTGKNLCQSLFFNKVANLLKMIKHTQTIRRLFPATY